MTTLVWVNFTSIFIENSVQALKSFSTLISNFRKRKKIETGKGRSTVRN